MRRFSTVLLIGGLAAITAGCLTLMPVGSHFQRGTDFTRYQTYAWGPADALPISDQRLRENPYFVDDVHGAIDREFQDRGLWHATTERADLLVHYHAAVTSRLEVQSRGLPGYSHVSTVCVSATHPNFMAKFFSVAA